MTTAGQLRDSRVPVPAPGGTARLAGRAVARIGFGAMQLEGRNADRDMGLAVLAPGPRSGSVVSLDAGETMALHRDVFEQLRHTIPKVDTVLTAALIEEVRRLAGALVDALYVPAEQRVWRRLRELVHIKLNLEMAATEEMVGIACALKPEMAMLVPEGREEVTTEGGLDVAGSETRLKAIVSRLTDAGIVTSVFIDARASQVEAAARIGARVCEIHTGPYAHAFHAKGRDPESAAVVTELAKIREAGVAIRALGMRFNAGHALNYFNVQPVAALQGLRELHIGHAIVSRSVFVGLREAVRQMKALLREAGQA